MEIVVLIRVDSQESGRGLHFDIVHPLRKFVCTMDKGWLVGENIESILELGEFQEID